MPERVREQDSHRCPTIRPVSRRALSANHLASHLRLVLYVQAFCCGAAATQSTDVFLAKTHQRNNCSVRKSIDEDLTVGMTISTHGILCTATLFAAFSVSVM